MTKRPVKLTNEQLVMMSRALSSVGAIKGNPSFAMAVALNMNALKPFIDALSKAEEPSDKFKSYLADTDKLLEDYGVQQPVEGGSARYAIPNEKLAAFKEADAALREKYKKAIEEDKKQRKHMAEVILKDYANGGDPIELYVISQPIPDEVDGNTLFHLMELIETP